MMIQNEKELPRRKQLRVKWHDYSAAGAYFVTICTRDRQKIFGDIVKDDHNIVGATLCGRPHHPEQMILKWLLEIERKFDRVKLDFYTIMPDHIHFVLFITGDHVGSPLQLQQGQNDSANVSLRNVIGWFKTMTTNEYIRQIKNGAYPPFYKCLWQRNYIEHIIRNEKELADIRNYIINNPINWYYKNKT